MGMTAAEKILARASGRQSVSPGEIVTAKVDLAMANDITAPLAIQRMKTAGVSRVFDPEKICVVAGRHAPFKDAAFAGVVSEIGRYCEDQGIEKYFGFGEGMDHALAPDLGYVRPGMLICNADSHACTYGALNALGISFGSTDIAYVFAFGETWFRIPETIRVSFVGERQPFVTSKDLVLATAARLGVDGARYKVIEYQGPALGSLSVDERCTITNMSIEMGAKSGIMDADDVTDTYLSTRTEEPWSAVSSDPDADFEQSIDIDVDAFGTLVAKPFLPSSVVPTKEVRGTKVSQVNIGTCTNGRLIDLRQAAEVMDGNVVARGVRAMITPATQRVYQEALSEGLIEVFAKAGCMVNPPGCGPCSGFHMGVLDADDVCMTTHNRNFHGRMGHQDARIYLASPYVAAATAVAGAIVEPHEVVGRREVA